LLRTPRTLSPSTFFFSLSRRPPRSTLFPTRRSSDLTALGRVCSGGSTSTSTGTVPPSSHFSSSIRSPKNSHTARATASNGSATRSEEHTSELQSLRHLVCRLLLEKKNKNADNHRGNP